MNITRPTTTTRRPLLKRPLTWTLLAVVVAFVVLGLHDWWLDGERVAAAFRAAGITMLENEAARVERGGRAFWVAGLADLWTREPDIAGSLAQVGGADEPVIILTHNP